MAEAAKASGKSKMTIQRAIKGGRISASRNDDGSYDIDPAELHRVFAPVPEPVNDTGHMVRDDTASDVSVLRLELKVQDEKIRSLEAERERERKSLESTIEDLRQRLNMESEERSKAQSRLLGLLTDQRIIPTKATQSRRSWWSFLVRST